jgi:hypothetical protein
MNSLKNYDVKNKYFLDEILQTTIASATSIMSRTENELRDNKTEVEKIIGSLFGKITYNWKIKVRNSALKGKYYNNLYYFQNMEELEYLFINKVVYDRVGIIPLYDKLESFFDEQGFEIYLVKKNGLNTLRISWEKYLDEKA